MLSQSSASSLLRWSCAHWLKRVASVISDVPLSVATFRAESWALIGELRSTRLRQVSSTWLLSPPLARATNDRPAVMFQPSDSYTCSTIPLEHRLHVAESAPVHRWAVALTMGGAGADRGQCARAAYNNREIVTDFQITTKH